MGPGFSPLDEELGLLPGSLTPSLQESVVRLGSWEPFAPAARMLEHFTRVAVSETTVRRVTERAGQAYVEVQTQQVEELERTLPEPPPGPALLQMSVDGAMVPLRGKQEWVEAKLLALGVVETTPPAAAGRRAEVHARELSYFARVTDHATFARLATVETHRRGVASAGRVCAVADGADWCQSCVDLHRLDAVRILDHPHASTYLGRAAQAAFDDEATQQSWLRQQRTHLLEESPDEVLEALRRLRDTLGSEAAAVVSGSLEYLSKRREQIRYAEFRALGYPIGSGIVESGNKLVTEARLKGAGMHWARAHVDPMLALRTVACSDRWEEAWPQIGQRLRQQRRERAAERRTSRQAALAPPTMPSPPPAALRPSGRAPTLRAMRSRVTAGVPATGQRRPAANHPWRRGSLTASHPPRSLPDRRAET